MGFGRAGRSGHGCLALPAVTALWSICLAVSAALHCANCSWKNLTCFCSMSRPTTSMPRPSLGCTPFGDFAGTVVLVTHDRYFLDQITGWILELDRGQGCPMRATIPIGWNKTKRMEQEARDDDSKSRTLARELNWIRQSPKRVRPNQKRVSMLMRNCWRAKAAKRSVGHKSPFRPARALGHCAGGGKPDQRLRR